MMGIERVRTAFEKSCVGWNFDFTKDNDLYSREDYKDSSTSIAFDIFLLGWNERDSHEKQMKDEKFADLIEEISEFLGDREMKNPHYLFDDEIVDIFTERGYKKKHIKKAIKEVR
jgi:hypothetical protein